MLLSVFLKSFSQTARRNGRRKVTESVSRTLEVAESRCLLSSIGMFPASPLPAGAKVSSGPAFTNPLTSIPQLSSLPGAPVTIYLDFDGHTESQDWPALRVDNQTGPVVTPVFDIDNDFTTFSDEELRMIREVWYRVSEDFAPFNVNVTTVDPGSYNNFETILVSIGGNGSWIGSPGGVAFINAFSNSASNTAYVFSDNTGLGGIDHMKGTAMAVSHEVGHTLGLLHHALFDTDGSLLAPYDPGRPDIGPIMGAPYQSERAVWANAPGDTSINVLQDDLAVMTRAANQTFRYRNDDYGNSIAAASPISITAPNFSVNGIIERNNDRDFFSFMTDSGDISLSVQGLNLRTVFNNPALNFGTNLDAVLRLYNSNGVLIAQSAPTNSLFATINATVTEGTYYAEVTHNGRYGEIGQYRLSGTVIPLETFTMSVFPTVIAENAGVRASRATVRRSDFANLSQPIVITLTNTDPTEISIPTSVTIPAGARTANFWIDAVDDNLLDGTQRVDIIATATIGGVPRSATTFIDVTDHETLSIEIRPDTIRENAGPNAARVILTRSNTDVGVPNTFSVVNNRLLEHNAAGNLVRTRNIPWPNGPRPNGELARDVVVMENGRIAVYNGTIQVHVSILNRATGAWSHIPVAGLTTVNAADTGGISSLGNYVFLTDMQRSAGDPFGVVRVDVNTGLFTRFATQSPGYRLFVKDIFADSIAEIDLATGATINTIPMPVSSAGNFGFNNGLAFDGTSLWLNAGSLGQDVLYQLNPDTGAVQGIHSLGPNNGFGWDGLAWLDGLIYATQRGLANSITVYDPIQRRVVDTLNVGTINNISISGGLAAITNPGRLLVTSSSSTAVYEINPATGGVTNTWFSGVNNDFGLGVANGEIYVGGFQSGVLSVFNRAGIFQRFLDINVTPPEGVFAIGGDDVLTLVPTSFRYRDANAGLDGKFYVLDNGGTNIGRYDATTLALEEFFTLARPVNAIAAAADGTLWGAGRNGFVYRFNASGAETGRVRMGTDPLIDIDLNLAGEILTSSNTGRIYRTSTGLAAPTSFAAGTTSTFVSFGRHASQSGGDLLVTLTNSDPTEVSIPSEVIIPAGRRTFSFPLDAVDDNIFDGPQIVTITAESAEYYAPVSAEITVLDAEILGVDISASAISEAAGPGATEARIYRTNVDGPFEHVERQNFRNTQAQTIRDLDRTISLIQVPTQISRITDVNVSLSLTHSFLPDLDIFLISPSGTRIELVTDPISNETSMTDTIFDDQARIGILEGTAPFTGRFRPEGHLDDLNGENPGGVWTLEITDDNVRHFGQLISWGLSIETIGLAPLTVNLIRTGDARSINTVSRVTIPANQAEVTVLVDAVDNMILDGTRTAGIRATAPGSGYLYAADNVQITDHELLVFTVSATTVSEAAGPGALTGRLTRMNSNISQPYTAGLISSDTTELTVQNSVTIPAGRRFVEFPINAVDDDIFDGTQTVTITVVAPEYFGTIQQTIEVTDQEPSLHITSSSSVYREDGGSFVITVERRDQTDISRSITVSLSVSEFTGAASPITVPATIVIPGNRTSQSVTVTINDDNLLDGVQSATIRATADGIEAGTAEFRITDHEFLTVTFDRPSVRENQGARAAIGTVTRSNTNVGQPLTVFLVSSDTTELLVPESVVIPAGSRSTTFFVDAVDDPDLDGTQVVFVSASAAGYFDGAGRIVVLDHEPPVVTGPNDRVAVSSPAVTWNPVPNALRYDVRLINRSTGEEQLYPGISASNNPRFVRTEPLGIGRYRVFVRAVDQLERPGVWSLARDFVVASPPRITAPVIKNNEAPGTFPEIAWTAVIDAAGYELVVDNNATGVSGVIHQRRLQTTSYRAGNLLGSGQYTARVRAFNSRGEYGDWSEPLKFAVLAAPDIVTPVSGGTFDRTPELSWRAVSGARTYDVMLVNRATREEVYRDRSVPGLSAFIPQDLPDGSYLLRVRAKNGSILGAWSETRIFEIGGAPRITAPSMNETTTARPRIVWSAISEAERYELRIQDVNTLEFVVANNNVTNATFTPARDLPLGRYRVTVRAISVRGEVTAWSESVDFNAGAVPRITSPANNTSARRLPTITWSRTEGAAFYILMITNANTGEQISTPARITGTSLTLTSNLPNGRYRVWVRAVSTAGVRTDWSQAVEFRVAGLENGLTNPNEGDLLVTQRSLSSERAESTQDVPQTEDDFRPGEGERSDLLVTMAHPANMPSRSPEVSGSDDVLSAFDVVMAAWDSSEWWKSEDSDPA